MEQRSLRLGDIVDDYCPRERRVTNHAIVAIVGTSIRQTRCSTCDAEHEYKEAKVPKKRGKAGTDSADLAGGVLVTPKTATNGVAKELEVGEADAAPVAVVSEPEAPTPVAAAPTASAPQADTDEDPNDPPQPQSNESWFTHRPLIRASLPRTDGEPPPQRAAPEFTMHQRHGRGFGGGGGGRNFRHGGHGHHHGGGGHAFRGHGGGQPNNNNGNGNEPDGNRAPQPGGNRPGGGGGGRRRRRRRPRN